MKKYCLILMLLISSLFMSGQALAEKKVLLSSINLPPYTGEQLPEHGFFSQIVTRAFAEAGYKVEYQYRPWRRALQEAKTGSVDGVMTAYWEKSSAEYLEYPDVVWKVTVVVAVLPNQLITYSGKVSDFRGYTIGVVSGSVVSKHLTSEGITTQDVLDHTQNILKLAAGRIDAMIIPDAVLRYKLSLLATEGKKIEARRLDTPYKVYDMYVAFSKANPEYKTLTQDFNRGIQLLKSKGEFDRIVADAGLK
ncbi:substrate-binding periplasmic protein [Vibrio sp. SCSIO 43137]|uniref:substrate-binding periplasmic protein n=1 Tax=Vibrio sp. SCSIO 43137 TaxID=3021011 RepID=UPI002307DCF9|nr:transporter substrate-binding domain-containing protein [Vibrio sp. SCSIO 43137]WCE28840.1 transporter substrate-binding domain-containing protein [Vibrio sp. SCSIO 43137]